MTKLSRRRGRDAGRPHHVIGNQSSNKKYLADEIDRQRAKNPSAFHKLNCSMQLKRIRVARSTTLLRNLSQFCDFSSGITKHVYVLLEVTPVSRRSRADDTTKMLREMALVRKTAIKRYLGDRPVAIFEKPP